MELTNTTPNRGDGLRVSQIRGYVVAIGCGLLLAICGLMAVAGGRHEEPGGVPCRLNPNTASVASLARLPGIGLTRASAIAAHRTRVYHETGRQAASAI